MEKILKNSKHDTNNSADDSNIMTIQYYGVRGSLPVPLLPGSSEEKIKLVLEELIKNKKYKGMTIKDALEQIPFHLKSTYGGNTSCVLVKIKGDTIILDAGSGIRVLGLELMGQEFGKGEGKAKIFLSHTHWDHIQGLPFFIPMYIPGNQFEFYSCKADIEDRLKGQQEFKYFPVSMENMPSERIFTVLNEEDTTNFGNFTLKVLKLNHPGDSFAYRIDAEGKSFAYSTDVEFNEKNFDQLHNAVEFFKDADILTFDSQYTLEESFRKMDWGHSSIQIGIDIAKNSNIKKLVLFHYDPTYSDQKIDEIVNIAYSYKKTLYPDLQLEIIPAYEGLKLEL